MTPLKSCYARRSPGPRRRYRETPRRYFVVRLRVGGLSRRGSRRGAPGEPHLERGDDGAGDLVLEREHIAHLAIVALAPEQQSVGGAGELRGDTHPGAGSAHRALQNATDVERRAHFLRARAPPHRLAELRPATRSPGSRASALVSSSAMPSAKYALAVSPLTDSNGSTARDLSAGAESAVAGLPGRSCHRPRAPSSRMAAIARARKTRLMAERAGTG
jgi:hypothetical protein